MKTRVLALAFGCVAASSLSAQTLIAEWNFNGPSATTVPGGATSPTPSTGSGVASLFGGVTASFSSGIVNGGSSDTTAGSPPNYGWQTTTYAAQGAESGGRGVAFQVSTVGFDGIKLEFDTRHSNTSSRWLRLDYATNAAGDNWVLGTASAGTVYQATAGGDTWYNNRTADLSTITAINDNPNFRFRIVPIFGPSSGAFDDSATYTQYVASTDGSTYGGTGTLRYDMVQVTGNPVPEPASLAALGVGAAALLRRRSRR